MDTYTIKAEHKPDGWDVWGLDVREEYETNPTEVLSSQENAR